MHARFLQRDRYAMGKIVACPGAFIRLRRESGASRVSRLGHFGGLTAVSLLCSLMDSFCAAWNDAKRSPSLTKYIHLRNTNIASRSTSLRLLDPSKRLRFHTVPTRSAVGSPTSSSASRMVLARPSRSSTDYLSTDVPSRYVLLGGGGFIPGH